MDDVTLDLDELAARNPLRGRCPRCRSPYEGGTSAIHRKSRDHILPQARGGRLFIHGGVSNVEVMCQACNSLRAACGHCWGVVACVLTVAMAQSVVASTILRRWKMHEIIPDEAAPLTHEQTRKQRSADAVKIGIVVHQVGLDEFVYPADTPAKQVWNIVTLIRGGYRSAG